MDKKQAKNQHIKGYVLLVVLVGTLLIFQGRQFFSSDDETADAEFVATNNVSDEELVTEEDGGDTAVLSDTTDLPILSDSSLSPDPNPYTFQPAAPAHDFQIYRVKRGDTPGAIAQNFGIAPETLLGGNPFLSQVSNALQTDTELIILPIDGLLHTVKPGDSLEELSTQYSVPVEDIVAYEPNNLTFPYRLQPETKIVVPGAVREVFSWKPPTIADVNSSYEGRGVQPVIVGTGSFVWPITSRNFTQRFWYGHPAIDVAAAEGSTIVAADTGTVTYAGWNNTGYGNLVVVNHGNGYETFYAHMSNINVTRGQIVYKGNVLGGVGNTGNSSGPHIHFEVRINANRDNPCWYIGC